MSQCFNFLKKIAEFMSLSEVGMKIKFIHVLRIPSFYWCMTLSLRQQDQLQMGSSPTNTTSATLFTSKTQ